MNYMELLTVPQTVNIIIWRAKNYSQNALSIKIKSLTQNSFWTRPSRCKKKDSEKKIRVDTGECVTIP